MNGFVQWLLSPLSEWHTKSLNHKLLIGLAGAGVAYYLHKYKDLPTWQLVLYSLAAAYGTSLILNGAAKFNGAALPAPVAAPALPAQAYSDVLAQAAQDSTTQGLMAPGADVFQQPVSPTEEITMTDGLDEGEDSGIFS